MIERWRTLGNAVSSELKGFPGARRVIVMEVHFGYILVEIVLRELSVGHLQYFVSSLLIHLQNRPIRICPENVRGLELDVVFRVCTPWLESHVCEQSSWESLVIEIINSGISNCKCWVNIIHFDAWISSIIYGELTKLRNESPVPLICEDCEAVPEGDREVGDCPNIFGDNSESFDHSFPGYDIHSVLLDIGWNQTQNSLVIDCEGGRVVVSLILYW